MRAWSGIPNDISNYAGFVYRIQHKNSGKYYLGKCSFFNKYKLVRARKPTKVETERLQRYQQTNKSKFKKYKKELRVKYKGLKKVSRHRKESDWKNYWGSSEPFSKYVAKEGKENFTRKILYLCETKSEMSYKELLEQVFEDVLNDNNSFNGIIHVRLNRTK